MKKYLNTIKIPIFIAIVNVYPGNLLYSLLPGSFDSIVFNLFRTINIFYASWLITRHNIGGLWQAALTGPLLLLVDHVFLKGGYFIFAQLLKPSLVDNKGFLAFIGVVGSYIIFAPLALLIGFIGGWFSRRHNVI